MKSKQLLSNKDIILPKSSFIVTIQAIADNPWKAKVE